MQIPSNILAKTNRFLGKKDRIIEEGWNYLKSYFDDENGYFVFLENLSNETFEQFLHTIFFYWAHDLYRIIKKEDINPNIDGFMYQITLSIIECLNKGISDVSRERIKDFFTEYFSDSGKDKLKDGIKARPIKDNQLLQIESWEILYHLRNKFVHEARWFTLRLDNSFTSLSISKEGRQGIEYIADIRIQYKEYLELFWQAYIKFLESRN